MATVTPKQLGQGQLGTTDTTLYTVPGTTSAVIRTITIDNTDVVNAQEFKLFLVPNGGTAGPATAIFFRQSVASRQTIQDTGVHVLGAGGKVMGQATASGTTLVVTVTVDGAEIV